jgi:cation transport regulator ChaC
MKNFVFAYGSLMCAESCSRTLHRFVSYTPAELTGFTRIFNATGHVYSEKLKSDVMVRFANLKVQNNGICHGLLFEVDNDELEDLKKREFFYDFVEVSSLIRFPENKVEGNIFTFISPIDDLSTGYILQKYLKLMDNAANHYPLLKKQLQKELELIKKKEILEGGFNSITGSY